MKEIDRLFFNRYALDPGDEVFVPDGLVGEYAGFDDYDDVYISDLDEKGWSELD